MADEQPRDGEEQQGGTGKYNPPDLKEAMKVIVSLEKRLGERDETIQTLKGQVSEFSERMSAIEQAQQRRLEEQGNYQELAKKYQTDLESLKPMAQRAEALEAIIRESNEARLGKIPEQQRGLVPVDYPPERLQAWLNANEALLMKAPAPDYNAGAGAEGGGVAKTQLTEEQRATAKRFGMTEEQYAERLQRVQSQE